MNAAIMIVWTVVSVAGSNSIAVSQTTNDVAMSVCERVQKKISDSDIKLPGDGRVVVAVTVKCIPKG